MIKHINYFQFNEVTTSTVVHLPATG